MEKITQVSIKDIEVFLDPTGLITQIRKNFPLINTIRGLKKAGIPNEALIDRLARKIHGTIITMRKEARRTGRVEFINFFCFDYWKTDKSFEMGSRFVNKFPSFLQYREPAIIEILEEKLWIISFALAIYIVLHETDEKIIEERKKREEASKQEKEFKPKRRV